MFICNAVEYPLAVLRTPQQCQIIINCPNIVHKEWIKHVRDFRFVCKIKRAIQRYPNLSQLGTVVEAHVSYYQTPLRCLGPVFTICFVFSLVRISSHRPPVIPATFRSLVPLIMWSSRFALVIYRCYPATDVPSRLETT